MAIRSRPGTDAWIGRTTSSVELEPGACGVIRQVSDGDAAILRYLDSRGLVPETAVEVLEKAPFDGPLTVRTGDSSHILGRRLASQIRVEPGISQPHPVARGCDRGRRTAPECEGPGGRGIARHEEYEMTAWLVGVIVGVVMSCGVIGLFGQDGE